MTTRAIVPNGDGEGSLGTSTAKWGAVYSSDPASGENSGQVPTTAWVQKILADALAKQKTSYEQAISTAVSAAKTQAKLDAHPVGSYYWSNDSTSPATLFGGTWEALPAGYTLIAQGSGSDSFGSYTYTAGQKYGERKHQLTTDEMPSHSHTLNHNSKNSPGSNNWIIIDHEGVTKWQGDVVGSAGGNAPHNNLPPVIASYAWRRTA
ncbi:phage baseplate protein [Acidaminococcus fermentans]|uniref:phage baseplate protein n=1 Tax=Acidaminococcus fermentans TaxID=905 RepID=UPI003F886B04